jgi:hypothetical protein
VQPDNLGTDESFTGGYAIDDAREIFGPYEDVFAGPMINHVDYTPKFGEHMQRSALCGSCHTLFTPILDEAGKTVGKFPEQVPYLEWRNSEYAGRGEHCQDCHMPRLDEPVKISARPPWLDPRQPFWRHQFVGGNAFMLTLLRDRAKALEPLADAAQFDRMIRHTRRQLANKTARLEVKAQRADAELVLTAEVQNLTGHKFPTGYPYRRAWLHVEVRDDADRVLFESGGVGKDGRLRGAWSGAYRPHYEEITRPEQVQVYQAIMGDREGQATTSLLRAHTYLKDNRIPPRGYRPDGPHVEHTAVCGEAAADPDFNVDGSGSDRITYRIPLPPRARPKTAVVELLYQPVPPESVSRLLESPGPAARTFAELYRRADKTPERVQVVRIDL